MVRKFKIVALVGALMMAASPAFAQDPMGDMMKGIGDPLAGLMGEPAAPAAAPAKKKMMRSRMMRKRMGGKMMMKKKMMGKPMMMKKPMMKKKMMGKPMMKKKM